MNIEYTILYGRKGMPYGWVEWLAAGKRLCSVFSVYSCLSHTKRPVSSCFVRFGKFGFVRFRPVSSGFSRLFPPGGGEPRGISTTECGIQPIKPFSKATDEMDFTEKQSAQNALLLGNHLWLCIGYKRRYANTSAKCRNFCQGMSGEFHTFVEVLHSAVLMIFCKRFTFKPRKCTFVLAIRWEFALMEDVAIFGSSAGLKMTAMRVCKCNGG